MKKHFKMPKLETRKFKFTGGIIIINVYTPAKKTACERKPFNQVCVQV